MARDDHHRESSLVGMGLSRDLDYLSEATGGNPSEFARLLEKLLTADFDLAFEFIKTQKLLHRRRSRAWISEVDGKIQEWLPSAPLKGKKRAQLARHFAFCGAIQEMLDIVDLKSQALKIWQASSEALLRALFSLVEDQREKLELRATESKNASEGALLGLRGVERGRRELRNYCDWVGRIVNQISLLGVRESGDAGISTPEINEALQMAAMADIILEVLDSYSYKNFPVLIRGKEIELRGIKSKTQQALNWSTMRERSRNIIDGYGIAKNMEESLALALPGGPELFEEFIEQKEGAKIFKHLRSSREQMAGFLRREVEELIDLDFSVQTPSGRFRADELVQFWALLFQVANCASIWRRVCRKGGVPSISRAKLASLAVASIDCAPSLADSLVSQFLLDPRERNQDPFFRPLVKLNDSMCLVASTFIATGRFARNLFTIAIREGRANFSPKGLKPLQDISREFSEAGYRVILNFPLRTPGGLVTDVDLAATKEGYLFVGQTKVLIHPDSAYDEWKVLENLKRAAQQLTRSMDHVQSLRDRLGVSDGRLQVVPFLLTNVWHYTGSTINGFKVVDFSYLSNILTGGEIWEVQLVPQPKRRIAKLVEGKYPTGEELSRLIMNPLHEEMFQIPRLKKRLITVGGWTVCVPVEDHDDASERRRADAFAKIFKSQPTRTP
jgi:hypothetical protein